MYIMCIEWCHRCRVFLVLTTMPKSLLLHRSPRKRGRREDEGDEVRSK